MEGVPNQESQERSQLVELLKTNGIESPETKELLVAWTEQQERLAESLGTSEARIDFEINRAQLYFDSGFVDEALNTLYDAQYIAEQEGCEEVKSKIAEKIQEFS